MENNKIGIAIIAVGGMIIIILLSIVIFVNPAPKTSPIDFKGPTNAPEVKGPKELPPR